MQQKTLKSSKSYELQVDIPDTKSQSHKPQIDVNFLINIIF